MISNSDIEKILDRADIVDVVGQFVQLQRSGVRYKACCPFHQEDTPSFMVDQARGLWYCFGACKEGGNVIKFVEKINNMNFPEACHWLADKYGIDIEDKKEEKNPEELKAIRKRASMFAINEFAAQYFLANLQKKKLTLHGPKSNRDGVSNILRSRVSVTHFLPGPLLQTQPSRPDTLPTCW